MTAPRAHYDHRTGTPRGHVVATWFGWVLVDLSGFIREREEGS